MDSQRKSRLINLITRLQSACYQVKRVYAIDKILDQLEAIVKEMEFYAEAATGKRTARATAMQKRSAVVPFGHPDKATFDRLNAIEDRDQGI